MAPFSCAVKPRIGECLLRHSPIRFGHKKKSRFFNQLFARCHPDLNWRMKVLQTFALPLGHGTGYENRNAAKAFLFILERVTRLELATSTLARWRSTG